MARTEPARNGQCNSLQFAGIEACSTDTAHHPKCVWYHSADGVEAENNAKLCFNRSELSEPNDLIFHALCSCSSVALRGVRRE